MRTNIVIDDQLMESAMNFGEFSTKKAPSFLALSVSAGASARSASLDAFVVRSAGGAPSRDCGSSRSGNR